MSFWYFIPQIFYRCCNIIVLNYLATILKSNCFSCFVLFAPPLFVLHSCFCCLISPPSSLPLSSPGFFFLLLVLLYFNPSPLRTILLSVISLLNEPNTFSPANVDASVMYRKWRDSRGKDREYIEIIRYRDLSPSHTGLGIIHKQLRSIPIDLLWHGSFSVAVVLNSF